MLKLFTVLDRGGFSYWSENIHSIATILYRKDIDDSIKLLLRHQNNINDVGFYKIAIKTEQDFIKLKWLEAMDLFMYKGPQESYFFLICGEVNEHAVRNLCYMIYRLEVSKTLVFKDFEKLLCVDKIVNIRNALNETQDLLMKNIEMVLDRGEKLDELIAKSEELKESSQMFKKKANQLNSCAC